MQHTFLAQLVTPRSVPEMFADKTKMTFLREKLLWEVFVSIIAKVSLRGIGKFSKQSKSGPQVHEQQKKSR